MRAVDTRTEARASAEPEARALGTQPTGGSPASLVLAGWEISSRDGHALGEVLGADRHRLLLADGDHPVKRLELPTTLIASQDRMRMHAVLRIDAADVVAGRHGIERVPRERDSA